MKIHLIITFLFFLLFQDFSVAQDEKKTVNLPFEIRITLPDTAIHILNDCADLIEHGKFSQTSVLLSKIQSLTPKDPGVPALQAYCKMVTGDLTGAKKVLENALVLDPDHLESLLLMGLVLSSQSLRESASQFYYRAMKFNDTRAIVFLMNEYLKSGKKLVAGQLLNILKENKQSVRRKILDKGFQDGLVNDLTSDIIKILNFSGRKEPAESDSIVMSVMLFGANGKWEDAYKLLDSSSELHGIDLKQIHCSRGYCFLLEEKYDLAEIEFKKVLEISDFHIAALLGLSEVYIESEKFSECRKVVQKFGEKSPACLLVDAYQMRMTGDYQDAQKIYKEVLSAFPGCEEAYMGYGLTLLHTESYQEARDIFRNLIKLDSQNYKPCIAISVSFFLENNFKQGSQILNSIPGDFIKERFIQEFIGVPHVKYSYFFNNLIKECFSLLKNKPEALYEFGKYFEKAGSYQCAIMFLEKATEKMIGGQPAIVLANLLEKQGRLTDAENTLIAALNQNRNQEDLYELACEILIFNKKYNEAIQILKQKLTVFNKNISTYHNLSELYIVNGNFTEAIRLILNARENHIFDENLLLKLGKAYFYENDLNNALICMNEIKKNSSLHSEAVVWISKIYLKKKQMDMAFQLLNDEVSSHPEELSYYSALGDIYKETNLFSLSEKNYQKVLESDPQNFNVNLNLARLKKAQGLKEEALVFYEYAIAESLCNVDLYLEEAEIYFEMNLYEKTENILNRAMEFVDEKQKIITLMLKSLIKQNKIEELKTIISNTDLVECRDYELLIQIGYAYLAVNEFEQALEIFKKVYALNAKSTGEIMMAIESFMQDKQYDIAEKYIKELFGDKIQNPDILSIKSIIYKEKGDYDTAMEAIDQAIILLPRKGDYYFIKSDILKAKGHEAGAILELKKGLEFETKNKEMLIKLGSLYVEKSMFKEALPIFLETLSKKINEFETYTNLGKIYLGMEDFESAHLCLERAVEINPDSQAPYYPLGQLNLKQNQIIEAIDYFKKGMELSGGGIEYLRALRDSFQELDKKQEAYYYAMAIVKTKDFNSSDYDKLGDISSTLKDYAKAVFYYKEASWLEPKNSEYLFKYGLSCVLAENYFEAKKALDTLVMNFKNSPSRTKAIELLTKINDKIKEVNGGVQKENKPDMQE